MSTGNNLEEIYSNSIKILKDLIAFKTVSGENNTQLIDYCDNILNSLGAVSFRTYDEEEKRVNLFSLDTIGYLLYFLNKIFFKQEVFPSRLKIFIWDKICTPITAIIDRLTNYNYGKCMIVIYKKN